MRLQISAKEHASIAKSQILLCFIRSLIFLLEVILKRSLFLLMQLTPMELKSLMLILYSEVWRLKPLMNGSRLKKKERWLLKEAHSQEWGNLDRDGWAITSRQKSTWLTQSHQSWLIIFWEFPWWGQTSVASTAIQPQSFVPDGTCSVLSTHSLEIITRGTQFGKSHTNSRTISTMEPQLILIL